MKKFDNRKLSSGLRKYMEFHDLEPKEVKYFPNSFEIPEYVCRLGKSIDIAYKSDKWGSTHDYIHDHVEDTTNTNRSYPCTYSPIQYNDDIVRVPKFILDNEVLVQLGYCLFYTFETFDGLQQCADYEDRKRFPKLYTIPSGKALIVVSPNSKLEALIWGGKLDVREEGIIN